jgi:uncharacterized repeat protein (TIGR04076 family)
MYDIICRVVENEFCPYVCGEYIIGKLTPKGLCSASFAAIWPFAFGMRHSEKTNFEDSKGEITISCPDGWVQFKLSRIKQDSPTSQCAANCNGSCNDQ